MSQLTSRRRLALWLARVAAWILPASRAEWAAAMEAELHYIDDDREALAWVIGYLAANVGERVKGMNPEKANLALAGVVAVLMLAAKWLFKGHGVDAILILLAAWSVPFGYLSYRSRGAACKRRTELE
jgi:hypothetical protein